MSATTIARPYAKAIFNHALETKKLSHWSAILQGLAEALLYSKAKAYVSAPTTTSEKQVQFLLSIAEQMNASVDKTALNNFIHLLAAHKRLLVLPDLYIQYEALKAEQEKTLIANVISYSPLTQQQQQKLIDSLSKRLQRQVTLDVSIDEALLGGAVIRAGDLVIDGSVRGQLNKLGTDLAA